MQLIRLLLLVVITSVSQFCAAQTDSVLQTLNQLPEKYIDQVAAKISIVDKKLSKQTLKALKKFEKQEARLQRKFPAKDSSSTQNTFEYSAQKIQQLTTAFSNMPDKAIDKFSGEYNAYLDTLKTTFKFLQQKGEKVINQSKAITDKLNGATSKLNVLQGKLQKN
jgi:hypothetical protein